MTNDAATEKFFAVWYLGTFRRYYGVVAFDQHSTRALYKSHPEVLDEWLLGVVDGKYTPSGSASFCTLDEAMATINAWVIEDV